MINLQFFYFPILVSSECLRISFLSFKRNAGVRINRITPFIILNISCIIASLVAMQTSHYNIVYSTLLFNILVNAGVLSLPVCMSVALAFEFELRDAILGVGLRFGSTQIVATALALGALVAAEENVMFVVAHAEVRF